MTPSFTAVDALAEQRTVTFAAISDLHPHPHNPRRDLGDLTELADSIRAHGIRQRLLVVPNPDAAGGWRIVIGHRRHAAAVLAGLESVPVEIDHALDEIGQRELMLVENLQRTDLTPVEEGDAYQGLLDLGVSQAEISRQTGRSAKTVRSRLRLRTLPEDARAKVHHGATLGDAERLLDFTDHPEHLKVLTERLGDPQFAHYAQRAADEVAREKRAAEIRADLEAQGVRVINEPPYDDTKVSPLSRLTDTNELYGAAITPAEHAACPGHVAWPGGYNAAHMGPVYGCDGWRRNGHHDRYSSGGGQKGPQTEEEKAERRALVENNKAAAAAQKVREAWLIQFLARAKPPADAAAYVAGVFALVHSEAFGEHGYALRLFGYPDVETRGDHEEARATRRAEIRKPARGLAYLMAIAAARVEKPMPKDFWRRRDPQVTLHLRTLASWGYPLSDLERTYLDGVQTELDVDTEQVEQ